VIVLAGFLSFTILFVASWMLPEPPLTVEEVIFHYEDEARLYIEEAIIAGQDEQQLIDDLQGASAEMLTGLAREVRADGFAPGVDVSDRSFGRTEKVTHPENGPHPLTPSYTFGRGGILSRSVP
jgi:hypothetical protein